MNNFGKTFLLTAAVVLSTAATEVSAQDPDSTIVLPAGSIVESIRSAHQRLDYETAETQAMSALEQFQRFNTEQLVEINVILALIHYSRNDTEASRRFFLSGLSLDPELEMDPLLVSPKILSFFQEVKSENEDGAGAAPSSESSYVRYVVLQDARPEAALRSMVVPGWGHSLVDRRAKGRVLLGAWAVTATGTIVAHVVSQSAKSDYLEETDPDLVEDKFDRYNSWHKARNVFAIGAATVWVYSLFDILLSSPSAIDRQPSRSFNFRADHRSFVIALRF